MVDLDLEAQQLTEFLQKIEPGSNPVEEILQKTVRFFEKMQAYIENLTAEQKKDAYAKLMEVSQKLMSITKVFIDSVGLSEDDLFLLMEKPTHFNEDQWKLVQESKQQITECAKKIAGALISLQPVLTDKTEPQVAKKDAKKHIPPPRSSWMKS